MWAYLIASASSNAWQRRTARILILKVLGVLERKIEEHPELLFDLHVETTIDGNPGKAQREPVGGEHMPGVAEAVPRKPDRGAS
jgi:hypothetical protein